MVDHCYPLAMPVITEVSIIEVGSKLGITKVDYNTAEISRTRSDSLPAVSAISLLRKASVEILQKALKLKANAGGAIKRKIEEFLEKIYV